MISEERKTLIHKLYREFGSYRKVAGLVDVSDNAVRAVILGLHKKVKKKPGAKPKLDQRDERRLVKAAKRAIALKKQIKASKIKSECNLHHVGIRTVQRKLKELGIRPSESQKPA